jgi:hypothetical protein
MRALITANNADCDSRRAQVLISKVFASDRFCSLNYRAFKLNRLDMTAEKAGLRFCYCFSTEFLYSRRGKGQKIPENNSSVNILYILTEF